METENPISPISPELHSLLHDEPYQDAAPDLERTDVQSVSDVSVDDDLVTHSLEEESRVSGIGTDSRSASSSIFIPDQNDHQHLPAIPGASQNSYAPASQTFEAETGDSSTEADIPPALTEVASGPQPAQFHERSNQRQVPEASTRPSKYDDSHYNPIWLEWFILTAFAILYFACVAALILLWRLSIHYEGFSVSSSANHNLWKYGPTAVLTVIVGLWRQVDFHGKTLSPWMRLRDRVENGSDNLLLDYVSPLAPVAFWKGLRNRDWVVPCTVGVLWLLKVAVSTPNAL